MCLASADKLRLEFILVSLCWSLALLSNSLQFLEGLPVLSFIFKETVPQADSSLLWSHGAQAAGSETKRIKLSSKEVFYSS